MTPRHDSMFSTLLVAGCAAALTLACSSGPGASGNGANSNAGQTSNTTTTSSDDAGTTGGAAARALMCTPSSAQTSACAGMAAGSGCTLTRSTGDGDGDADDDGGVRSIAGTCRSTFDGTGVACVPNPPAPPAALTGPCGGKASGDACTVQGPFGGTFDGTCFALPGSGTLICGRVRMPPQPLVDACSGKAAGDGCSFGGRHDAGVISGVCGNGPTGQGPLACAPSHEPGARLAAACDGLDAGVPCFLGKGQWGIEGECTAPAGGGAAVCLPPCPEPGHQFRRFPHLPQEPMGPTLDGGHW